MEDRAGWGSGLRQLTLVLAVLGLVLGAMAGLLRGLDALAGYLGGEPRGVKRYRSIEEVEKKLGARVFLPAYFPDTLERPPAGIRLVSGSPPSLAVSFLGREGKTERLFVYQTVGGADAIPSAVLPSGQLLHTTVISLDASEGTLSRVLGEDGEIWHVLTWQRRGRQLALRFKGSVEELLRMARSLGP